MPRWNVQLKDASSCSLCPPNAYSGPAAGTCTACPSGHTCAGVNRRVPMYVAMASWIVPKPHLPVHRLLSRYNDDLSVPSASDPASLDLPSWPYALSCRRSRRRHGDRECFRRPLRLWPLLNVNDTFDVDNAQDSCVPRTKRAKKAPDACHFF
ncbi:hypothetical protein B0H12DRAFT_1240954 [Mycena haematopus]|nr:hypothetical protein B0H12DRAFT_1240954 [Mycena haematopus]